tara:strand:+ start:701 stop:934 length:234 start_codon:yes stop_codon:yes gene_type:complete
MTFLSFNSYIYISSIDGNFSNDIGAKVLLFTIISGFFLIGAVIVRSIEIGIKVYLKNRKKNPSIQKDNLEKNRYKGF